MVYCSKHSDITIVAGDGPYKPEEDEKAVPLTQAELNDLKRNLNLLKASAQMLDSRLRETSVDTSNNVLLVSRPRERIKMLFFSRISHHWFITVRLLN